MSGSANPDPSHPSCPMIAERRRRGRIPRRLRALVVALALECVLMAGGLLLQSANWYQTPRLSPMLLLAPPLIWAALWLWCAVALAYGVRQPVSIRIGMVGLAVLWGIWAGGYTVAYLVAPSVAPITLITLWVFTAFHLAYLPLTGAE